MTPNRRGRRLLALGILALLVSYHPYLLSACAWPLESSNPICTFNHLLVLDGDRCFDHAAEMGRDRQLKYIVSSWQPSRLVRRRIMPTRSQISVTQLMKHGIAPSSISLLSPQANSTAHLAQILDHELSNNPKIEIAILCDAFHTRALQITFNSKLSPKSANRISIIGLPNRQFDRNNWWQSKAGLLAVFYGYIDLYFATTTPTGRKWKECDPTDISRSIRN